MIFVFSLILILIIFYIYQNNNEYFAVYWFGQPVENLPDADNYPNFPFWNTRMGQTNNMSYDLRGDPVIIPKYPFMWNYSTLTPIYNKKLC